MLPFELLGIETVRIATEIFPLLDKTGSIAPTI
jgi:hypothetical protein